MALRSETPEFPGSMPVRTQPASHRPTSTLKTDIDRGATGDKVKANDLGLTQLGSDNGAAGHSPSCERIALARETEAAHEIARRVSQPHGPNAWVVPGYCVVVTGAGFVLGLSIWLV